MKLRRYVYWSVLAVAGLILAGCASSTPQSRIKRNQALFDSFPAEVQQKIRAGEVAPGFVPEQVRMALGEPDRVSKVTTATGEGEVWSYSESKPSIGFGLGMGRASGSSAYGGGVSIGTGGRRAEVRRVTFIGGKVTAIEHAK